MNTRKEDKSSKDEKPQIDDKMLEVQYIFFRKLEEKTGWGRNDIKRIFTDSVNEIKEREEDMEECPF